MPLFWAASLTMDCAALLAIAGSTIASSCAWRAVDVPAGVVGDLDVPGLDGVHLVVEPDVLAVGVGERVRVQQRVVERRCRTPAGAPRCRRRSGSCPARRSRPSRRRRARRRRRSRSARPPGSPRRWAAEVKEMPTLAWTTWLPLVSKVRYRPSGPVAAAVAACFCGGLGRRGHRAVQGRRGKRARLGLRRGGGRAAVAGLRAGARARRGARARARAGARGAGLAAALGAWARSCSASACRRLRLLRLRGRRRRTRRDRRCRSTCRWR